MKKLTALLLTLTLLASTFIFAIPVSATEDTTVTDSTDTTEDTADEYGNLYSQDGLWKYKEYNRIRFSSKDDYSYRITSYYGDETDVTLPEEIDGHKITCVSTGDGWSTVENLTIPVTYDYFEHINFENLKTVTFSRDYEAGTNVYINDKLFSGCASLESVVLPNIMTYTYTSYHLWGDVESTTTYSSIPGYCFANCTSLKSIVFPEDVTEIGMGAFMGCSSLEELVIPDSVELIDEGAFEGCTSLKTVTLPNSLQTYKRSSYDEEITFITTNENIWDILMSSLNTKFTTYSEEELKEIFNIIIQVDTEVAGDVNGDGTLDINDVTIVQKKLADIYTFDINNSDYNSDGKTNIRDATEMQRALAHISET